MFPNIDPEKLKQVQMGAIKYGSETPFHKLVGYNQIDQILVRHYSAMMSAPKPAAEVLPGANKELIKKLKEIQEQYQD